MNDCSLPTPDNVTAKMHQRQHVQDAMQSLYTIPELTDLSPDVARAVRVLGVVQ